MYDTKPRILDTYRVMRKNPENEESCYQDTIHQSDVGRILADCWAQYPDSWDVWPEQEEYYV